MSTKGPKKQIAIAALLALLLFGATNAFGQTNNKNLSDAEVKERITYIQSALDEGELCSEIWYWGWIGAYGTATAVQFSLFFAPDAVNSKNHDHARQDMMAGAITSLLGVAGLAIDPMVPAYAPDRLRAMPGDSPAQRREKLKQAEYWLKRSAQRELDGRGWLSHTLNLAVNLAAGLTLWLGFDRKLWPDALLTFLPGFAIGEIQIFTQPTRAVDDWEKYQAKYGKGYSYRPKEITRNWFMAASPGGFVAGLHF